MKIRRFQLCHTCQVCIYKIQTSEIQRTRTTQCYFLWLSVTSQVLFCIGTNTFRIYGRKKYLQNCFCLHYVFKAQEHVNEWVSSVEYLTKCKIGKENYWSWKYSDFIIVIIYKIRTKLLNNNLTSEHFLIKMHRPSFKFSLVTRHTLNNVHETIALATPGLW